MCWTFVGIKTQLSKSAVAVEKLGFRSERPNFWGWKMSCDPRGSLIRHPDAILFSRFLQLGTKPGTVTTLVGKHLDDVGSLSA